ncbi:MAG: YdcF family protein [Candidatus Azambacteria bacterium]|nr:YdcF family protein [Candidatus Azambacteria bacterium]
MNLIAVFGGWMEKDSNDIWHSTDFSDMKNHHGAPGSNLRAEAAAILFNKNPDGLVAAFGGRGQLSNVPDAPTLAEVIKRELVALGVPEEKIIEEENSGTTYRQLQELMKIAEEVSAKEITIVSNRYHLPRIQAMAECAPLTKDAAEKFPAQGWSALGRKINFVSAEEVLIEKKPEEWKAVIEKAYASAEMEELIKKEESGAKQIREGKYKFN